MAVTGLDCVVIIKSNDHGRINGLIWAPSSVLSGWFTLPWQVRPMHGPSGLPAPQDNQTPGQSFMSPAMNRMDTVMAWSQHIDHDDRYVVLAAPVERDLKKPVGHRFDGMRCQRLAQGLETGIFVQPV